MRALPSERIEIDKLPRAYIANIIQTLAKDDFADWVKQRIETRNAKLATNRELDIQLNPAIAAVFQASNAISGKSN